MANTNPSANMNMPVPVVGVDPGPDWANQIVNCLTILDQHNHAPGYGVPINPNGLDINADLPINNNNLTLVRSVNFLSQLAPLALVTDVGCIYESGVDLYYNDGNSNVVRITQGGALAGTPGSIGGLVPPASVTYVSGSQTFVFQSNVNTPANLDAGFIILRNNVVNSNGLTLQPPAAMGSNYSIVLPFLPASQSFVSLDSSGNMAAVWQVDTTSINISSNKIQIAPQGVSQDKLALRSTGTTVGAGGVAVSASSGNFSTNSVTSIPITNLAITITTLGRPTQIELISDGSVNASNIGAQSGGQDIQVTFFIKRDTTVIATYLLEASVGGGGTGPHIFIPSSALTFVDLVAAGTYTYSIEVMCDSINPSPFATCQYSELLVYEI